MYIVNINFMYQIMSLKMTFKPLYSQGHIIRNWIIENKKNILYVSKNYIGTTF